MPKLTKVAVAITKEVMRNEMQSLEHWAGRLVLKESITNVRRLSQVMDNIARIFAEPADGDLSQEEAKLAYQAFVELAAISIAQVTAIRVIHPHVTSPGDDFSPTPLVNIN